MSRMLTLDQAKEFLGQYNRWTLSDGTFGGSDVGWIDEDNKQVAGGWFEGDVAEVSSDPNHPHCADIIFEFKGADALELRYCGKSSRFQKNDPDEDTENTMLWSDPGLLDDPAYQAFLQSRL